MSFETTARHPNASEAGPRAPRRDHCDMCGRDHPLALCDQIVDEPLPDGPIGSVHEFQKSKPAVPLDKYTGPGRVIVLPPGVTGDMLQRERIGQTARRAWKRSKGK